MADSPIKGSFHADIPADAVEEALRSVERRTPAAEPGAGEAEAAAAPEAAGAEELAPGEGGLEERVRLLEAALERAEAAAREGHDRLLRAAADLENFKKRAAREREEVQRFGNEAVVKDLLPVVDGLDRALAAAPAGDAVADGVRLVRASLEQALAKHGVSAFSAMGERFDPVAHEALLQVPTDAQPPGTVVLEHARGFKLHGRLVRPAMVGVAVATPPDGRSEG